MTPFQETCLGFVRTLIVGHDFLRPSYIMAHIEIESNWNPLVHSSDGKGSIGLMQVLPATAAGVGMAGKNQAGPATSIETGIKVLAQMWDTLARAFGTAPYIDELVMAYNEGAGNVINGRVDQAYWLKWGEAQAKWAYVDNDA